MWAEVGPCRLAVGLSTVWLWAGSVGVRGGEGRAVSHMA